MVIVRIVINSVDVSLCCACVMFNTWPLGLAGGLALALPWPYQTGSAPPVGAPLVSPLSASLLAICENLFAQIFAAGLSEAMLAKLLPPAPAAPVAQKVATYPAFVDLTADFTSHVCNRASHRPHIPCVHLFTALTGCFLPVHVLCAESARPSCVRAVVSVCACVRATHPVSSLGSKLSP